MTSEKTCFQVKGHGYWSPSEKKFKFRLKVKGIQKQHRWDQTLYSQRQVTDKPASKNASAEALKTSQENLH